MFLQGFGVGFQKKAISALLAAVHLEASTVPGEHNSNVELFIKKYLIITNYLKLGKTKCRRRLNKWFNIGHYNKGMFS